MAIKIFGNDNGTVHVMDLLGNGNYTVHALDCIGGYETVYADRDRERCVEVAKTLSAEFDRDPWFVFKNKRVRP